MKNIVILLLFIALFSVVFWYFGRQYERLTMSQEATNDRLLNVEARLLPIEADLQQRKAIRAKATTAFGWFWKGLASLKALTLLFHHHKAS